MIEDAPDLVLLGVVAGLVQQLRAQFKWFGDIQTGIGVLLVAAYMVTFNHHADWSGHGGFWGDQPIYTRLLLQHIGTVCMFLYPADKIAHLTEKVPVLNQIFPKFNQRANGKAPDGAQPQQGGS